MISKGETLFTIANTNFQINHASHTVYFPHAVYSITQFWQLTFPTRSFSLPLFIGFNRHLTSSIHSMYCTQCSHNSNNSKSNYTYTHSFVRCFIPHPVSCNHGQYNVQCKLAIQPASQLTIDQNDIAKGAQQLRCHTCFDHFTMHSYLFAISLDFIPTVLLLFNVPSKRMECSLTQS